MATIILGVAAGALIPSAWGPTAAAIATGVGSALGGYIDQTLLFPAVFGKKNQNLVGPRIDDRQLFTASEGQPINYVRGIARCSGNMIWAAPLEEVQTTKTEGGGGKGGGGGSTKVTSFTYYRTFAIGICEGVVKKLDKVWADGKLIYQQGGFRNLLLWSDAFQESVWVRTHCGVAWNLASDFPPAASGYGSLHYEDRLRVGNIDAKCGQKSIRVQPETEYTFSFWTHTGQVTNPRLSIWDATHDAYIVEKEVYTAGTGVTWVRATRTFTTPAGCHEIHAYVLDSCDAWNTHGALYIFGAQLEEGSSATDYDRTEAVSFAIDPQYDDLKFYSGSETQLADSVIESYEGATNVPAFRGNAYIRISRLNLTNFGNRIPQFNFQMQEDNQKLTKNAFADIMDRAGFTSYDVSLVGNGRLRGLRFEGPQVPARILEQMMLVFQITCQERAGRLYFASRGNPKPAQYTSIPDSSMSARVEGGDGFRRVKFNDAGDDDIPAVVTMNYFDVDMDFQRGQAMDKKHFKPSDNVLSIDIPVAFGAVTARSIVRRLLYTGWAERVSAELYVGPEWAHLQEADLIKFVSGATTYYCRVSTTDDGNNFIKHVKAIVEYTRPLNTTAPSVVLTSTAPPVFRLSKVIFVVADIPALRDEDFVAGFYFGACLEDSGQGWRGATLVSSTDDITWANELYTNQQATLGVTTTKLESGPENAWDHLNTVTLTLYTGTLESRTSEEVIAGQNWILIGKEIVGFQNAVLTAPNTYVLSELIRGLRGTVNEIRRHAIGDQVMLLDGTIRFVSKSLAVLGQARDYRCVPTGGTPEEFVTTTALTLRGGPLLCFPVTGVASSRDGSNNISFSWKRTTRAITSIFSIGATAMMPDELDAYEIDICTDGLFTTVLRTITASGQSSSYSAANQVTDGLTPGAMVYVAIYQMSTTVGRGLPRRTVI